MASFVSAGVLAGGCKSDGTTNPGDQTGVLRDVQAIVFVQRVASSGTGNVFDYTHYVPGGRLVKLEPPAPDGKLTVLTAGPMFQDADVMSWDLSFDAREIVFSARTKGDGHFQLFLVNVDGTNARQITEGPYDHVYPIFVPGGRIMFMTSQVVEEGAKQFADEYERQTTSQVGLINRDGSRKELGPRNVSHRVAPALMPDGRVLYTEWRHLGPINDGHLRLMNPDMTGMREAFGGEGRGVTNSYLKARYVGDVPGPDGKPTQRIVTVATSRDRTLQAGKLVLVDLNGVEKAANVRDLTPLVPGGNAPSTTGVGRYYDAEVVGAPADLRFLVSWADGTVQSEILEEAKTKADFGVYVLDGNTGKRFPVYNDPAMWDVMARPIVVRPEPQIPQSPVGTGSGSFVVGALDVYQSSVATIERGTVTKVRLLEGFSGEEGFTMFGTTEFDGQSLYREVDVMADGSFAAKVPANVPLHMQLIDKFAMAIVSEDIWISGRPGEERFCGGCHEDRSKQTMIPTGGTMAMVKGPVDLDVPRAARVSMDFSYDKVRGVPWDLAIQPIFDAKCVACHDGDPAKPGNPTYTVVDKTVGMSQTFTFDLRGQKVPVMVGEKPYGDYTASYLSIFGLGEMLGENNYEIQGEARVYAKGGLARERAIDTVPSVIERLNPPQRFPALDKNVRAWAGKMPHPADVGRPELELTPDEYYLLILNIDMGGQFFFRENKKGY